MAVMNFLHLPLLPEPGYRICMDFLPIAVLGIQMSFFQMVHVHVHLVAQPANNHCISRNDHLPLH